MSTLMATPGSGSSATGPLSSQQDVRSDNVEVSFSGSVVLVQYDLLGTVPSPLSITVTLHYSIDGGPFKLAEAVSGNGVGEAVAAGTAKQIVWRALEDEPSGIDMERVEIEVRTSIVQPEGETSPSSPAAGWDRVAALTQGSTLRVELMEDRTIRSTEGNAVRPSSRSFVGRLVAANQDTLVIRVVEGTPSGTWEIASQDIQRVEAGTITERKNWLWTALGAGAGVAAAAGLESANPSCTGCGDPIRDNNGFVIGYEDAPSYGKAVALGAGAGAAAGLIVTFMTGGERFQATSTVFRARN